MTKLPVDGQPRVENDIKRVTSFTQLECILHGRSVFLVIVYKSMYQFLPSDPFGCLK